MCVKTNFGKLKMNKNSCSIFLTIVGFLVSVFLGSGCSSISTPKWDKCTKSSNWHGANASERMMNILSPHMPDSVFKQRVSFMKSRGCNTAHVILSNYGDGEYCRYSIYGADIPDSRAINKDFTNVMSKRLKQLRKSGYGVVLWLMTDDSTAWNRKLASNPQRYVDDIASLGWFDLASTVCVGLELNEYFKANQVQAFVAALRTKYKGKIAVHHTSGRGDFANLADLLFWQIEPTNNKNTIINACNTALRYGKPVNMFETYRSENRETSEVALEHGCYAVGNW